MIGDIIRFTSFLLPIPFMALFYIKTDKFDFIKKYAYLAFLIPVFMQLFFKDIGYTLELTVAYIAFVLFGTSIFNRKGWSYLQALSLSFCLVYFGSFLWELPYHVYTIIVRGGVDGSFPLQLIYIFPIIFIYEKVKTNQPSTEISGTLFEILGFSMIVMIALVYSGYDIWNTLNNIPSERAIEETLWMITRLVTMVGLFSIYSKASLRKESKIEKEKK